MKFAAIDIGSNAVRLLFAQVFEDKNNTVFKKDALFRVPIRLGDDVFQNSVVSDQKINDLVNAIVGFKFLIRSYQPLDYMACATSAMREASNKKHIINRIRRESQIKVQIINGKQEADILYSTHTANKIRNKGNYLYIDVGGGSTEISFISNSKELESNSFNIGTVRMLKNHDLKSEWKDMKKWLKENSNNFKRIQGIGSGGNINKVFKMLRKKEDKPVTYKNIKTVYDEISSYNIEDRIKKLGIRPDRADVIIPALNIYLSVMRWAGIKKIYVPQIGLSDGIIHVLYEKHKKKYGKI